MTSSEELKDREQQTEYHAPRVNLSLADFDITGRVGDGSFSTVIMGTRKTTGKQYAIKIINKHLVLRNKVVEYIKNERNILDKLNDDGIAKLHFTFQDADSLYMGLEYCAGGELFDQIRKRGQLPLDTARFYAAELVLILEYLRSMGIVHRDLKPENLLLSASGHLKLIDFGSAKAEFLAKPAETPAAPAGAGPGAAGAQPRPSAISRTSSVDGAGDRTSVGSSGQAVEPRTSLSGKPGGAKARQTSFVGTAEYVSPEVLKNEPLSFPADLWALGCMLYQMLHGKPPFKGASEYLTFQKVADRDFTFPDEFPPDARDLVDKLLQIEPQKRIGAASMDELKAHPFFAGIDWATLRSQQAPEYLPPDAPEAEQEGLDWELNSLVRDLPLQYEYP